MSEKVSNPASLASANSKDSGDGHSQGLGKSLGEKEIFFAAIEIDSEPERQKYVEEKCAGNPTLKKRLQDLLASHLRPTFSLLDDPVVPSLQTSEARYEAGIKIADYELSQLIGVGGMGEVWLAQQSGAVNRSVAIKLIQPGFETPGMIKRFESERQALASMEHPNIASVLDAGTTREGQPYFVMELIHGVSLTQYCDEAELGVRQRLEIFRQIAAGIQHAHQKGVIHRDLKPSNILVTEIDSRPVPKIIDFGLAKVIEGQLQNNSALSQFGMVMGSIDYMAPEQSGFTNDVVDTRSDIYSLGIVLYELLTGSHPFDSKDYRTASVNQKLKIISDGEPTRPSTRVSTIESSPKIAKSRQSDPESLRKMLKRELDWVVLKAINKDRNSRYQTVDEFAREIDNFLAGKAVSAHPPSTLYMAKKFVVRNLGLVAASFALLLTMAAGLVGTSHGLRRAKAAKLVAIEKQAEAEQARDEARRDAGEAIRQQNYSQSVAEFLKHDLLGLTTIDGQLRIGLQHEELGHSATIGDLLDRAAEKLKRRTDLDPRVRAELLRYVGVNLRIRTKFNDAIGLLQECCDLQLQMKPLDFGKVIQAHNSLAVAYSDQRQLANAIEVWEEGLSYRPEGFPASNSSLISAKSNLANTYATTGRFEDAQSLIADLLGATEDRTAIEHSVYCTVLLAEAKVSSLAGETELAIEQFEHVIEKLNSRLDPWHPTLIAARTDYAGTLLKGNRLDAAKEIYDDVFEIEKQKFGSTNAKVLDPLNNIAATHWRRKEYSKSITAFESLVKLSREIHGPDHPEVFFYMVNLAVNYRDGGQLDQAVALFEEVLRSKHGPDFTSDEFLAALVGTGDRERFGEVANIEMERLKAKFPASSEKLAFKLVRVANRAMKIESWELAVEILREVVAIQGEVIPDHWHIAGTRHMLGKSLFELGDLDEAKSMLVQAFEGMEAKRAEVTNPDSRLQGIVVDLQAIARIEENADELAKWKEVALQNGW